MIEIINKYSKLIAIYTSKNGINWLIDKLNNYEEYTIKNTYTITKDKILELKDYDEYLSEEYIAFQIGNKEGSYYSLEKDVFGIDIDVFIDKDINITPDFFTANKNISILSKISDVIKGPIYIILDNNYKTNTEDNNIPISAYKNLLKSFPNNTELIKYSNMRIATALSEYFNNLESYKVKYEKYLNNKILPSDNIKFIINVNTKKLSMLQECQKELQIMLKNCESFRETDWQIKIKDILCVLFPKYLYAIREVNFGDINGYDKHPDYTLIDSNGYLDIMEIKKPDDTQIIRNCKNRNNYVPQKIFTDVIVQTTKYLNALNQNHIKSKSNVIKKLNEEYPNNTLSETDIFINNPKALILIGRSDKLIKEQRDDFELIKRQYKDIAEIMTYDDLLYRLNNLIKKIEVDFQR